MEINKKELRKISRRFRTLASNVMNAYFGEQTDALIEFIDYVKGTSLIFDYVESLAYDIEGLESELDKIASSYGSKALELGADSRRRTYLLYRAFDYIALKKLSTTDFGRYYAHSKKYQDMAKAFGDRLIYPFVIEIEEYIKDIATDMGFDNDSSYNITINSSGVQVNIAEHGSTVNAEQANIINAEAFTKAIENVEDAIEKLENTESKSVLKQNLEIIKNEIQEPQPKQSILTSAFNTIKFIATAVALTPDLTEGIELLASVIGINS
ncbi:TPA: conjugal transfer protein [Streptococcus suis]|nr:conjugal transfer protein [Streptococcus suis]HEM5148725.1 conjugal transfer protein [Streptococcus suis]HEM5149035.1 conjugal transfer protein [Streptococcus suis]HEM5204538.1 conjugal transfer protein [Streptococcus suis]HEM5215031.1 conjugal transfer protein [Streptococcus suis]